MAAGQDVGWGRRGWPLPAGSGPGGRPPGCASGIAPQFGVGRNGGAHRNVGVGCGLARRRSAPRGRGDELAGLQALRLLPRRAHASGRGSSSRVRAAAVWRQYVVELAKAGGAGRGRGPVTAGPGPRVRDCASSGAGRSTMVSPTRGVVDGADGVGRRRVVHGRGVGKVVRDRLFVIGR